MQYADLVRIKPSYLITMLDQPAFKAVELLKLSEFQSFDDFTAQLINRFDSGKTREDYSYSYMCHKLCNYDVTMLAMYF